MRYLCSFGGIGIGEDKIETLVEKIKYENKKAHDRWTKTQVLIIDESKERQGAFPFNTT